MPLPSRICAIHHSMHRILIICEVVWPCLCHFSGVTKICIAVLQRIQSSTPIIILVQWMTANNPSSKEDDLINSPFPRLYGNTLVSVQTIASLNNERQQQDAALGSKSSSKVVFIDGSWYHRPDPITKLPRNPTQDFISGPRLPAARYVARRRLSCVRRDHDIVWLAQASHDIENRRLSQ